MWGFLLKVGLALAPALLPKVMGWFGYAPKKDQRDKDVELGEELGRAKQAAATTSEDLKDARKAIDAGRRADAANSDGRALRDRRPGDRAWNPDALE